MYNNPVVLAAMITRSDKIITKLKMIGSIKSGQYWCTYAITPQPQGLFTSTLRTFWYTHEDRDLNMADLEECIDSSFLIINDIKDIHKDVPLGIGYQKIIDDLKTNLLVSQDGISNLKVTYHDDQDAISRLNRMINSLKERYSGLEPNANA